MYSGALRCTQVHSDALRCTQMHSAALRRGREGRRRPQPVPRNLSQSDRNQTTRSDHTFTVIGTQSQWRLYHMTMHLDFDN